MPISTTENESTTIATSTTPSIPFRDSLGASIPITAQTDLVVTHTDSGGTETVLTLTTHYTVTLVAVDELYTATVDILGAAGVAVDDTITIVRSVPFNQLATLEEGAEIPAKTWQKGFDKLTILCQQLLNRLAHAVRFPESSGSQAELTPEASTMLALDSSKALTLWDKDEVLTFLGLSTSGTELYFATWADDAARAAKTPDFVGQPGIQTDKLNGAQLHNALYIAGSTTAGDWDKFDLRGKGADIASASALTLGTDGDYFDVTGTTTITSITTWNSGRNIGRPFRLHFDGALTLTYHATNLILPSNGANITTAAGDECTGIEYEAGKFRILTYTRANGMALDGSASWIERFEIHTPTSSGVTWTGGTGTSWSGGEAGKLARFDNQKLVGISVTVAEWTSVASGVTDLQIDFGSDGSPSVSESVTVSVGDLSAASGALSYSLNDTGVHWTVHATNFGAVDGVWIELEFEPI